MRKEISSELANTTLEKLQGLNRPEHTLRYIEIPSSLISFGFGRGRAWIGGGQRGGKGADCGKGQGNDLQSR